MNILPERLTFKDDLPEGKYNGYTNYQTWNVALFLDNSDDLQGSMNDYKACGFRYKDFAEGLLENCGITETPDGIALNDSALNIDELNEEFFEN